VWSYCLVCGVWSYDVWYSVVETESLGTAAYCTGCSSGVRLSPLVLEPTVPAVAVG
jgi:hypothetical protein